MAPEVHAGRSGLDVGDWTADTLGGLGGSVLCCAVSVRRRRQVQSAVAEG